MKLERFEKILKNYREGSDIVSELYGIGFDLMEGKYKLSDSLYRLFISSLESHYTQEGVEWIIWFIFENEWGDKDWGKNPKLTDNGLEVGEEKQHGATDENGTPICYDIPSLWRYIENGYKIVNCGTQNTSIH